MRRWLQDLIPLELELALAGYRRGERLVPFLTALALGLAVALSAALEMSLRTMDEAITTSAKAIAGSADLEILAGGTKLREELIAEIRASPGVADAQGILIHLFRLADGAQAGQPLHIVAVDLARPRAIHGYDIESNEVELSDPLRLLASSNSIAISRKLADRLHTGIGDELAVRSELGRQTLRVEGIIDGTLSEAFAGLVAVMDIYALQDITNRRGWIDRIDVVLDDPSSADEVEAVLSERLEGVAKVSRPATHTSWAGSILEGLRAALTGLIGIGSAVAVLIAYATTSRRAAQRRREFSTMRTSGMSSHAVTRVFVLDSLLLGAAGTTLGLPFGVAIAPLVLNRIAELPSAAQTVDANLASPTAMTVIAGAAVGLVVAGLGALVPALGLSKHLPLDPRGGVSETGAIAAAQRRLWLSASAAALALAIAAAMPGLGPIRAAVALVCGGYLATCLVRAYLADLVAGVRTLLDDSMVRVGAIVGTSLLSRPTQAALATTTVSVVLAAFVALTAVIDSVSAAVVEWTGIHYDGSIYVQAGPLGSDVGDVLAPETVDQVRKLPGVVATSPQYVSELVLDGLEVDLISHDLSSSQAQARLQSFGRDKIATAQSLLRGEIAVSPSFAARFETEPGDSLRLPTASGGKLFTVVDLVNENRSTNGSVLVHSDVLLANWPVRGPRGVRVWATDEDGVATALLALAEPAGLHVYMGDEIARRVGERVTVVTSSLFLIALLIGSFGGAGIVTTLIGTVADRSRELATLGALGFSRQILGAAAAFDGIIAAAAATLIGLALGLVVTPIFASTTRDALGWTFETRLTPEAIAPVVAVAFVAAAGAALYPAFRATRVPPDLLIMD